MPQSSSSPASLIPIVESEAAQSTTSSIVSEVGTREQAVLERIMGSNHEAILDGHKFAKQLGKELDTLGKVRLHQSLFFFSICFASQAGDGLFTN